MRVITNGRCIAEQTKSDRVKKVAMDGPKVLENVVMDRLKVGKFGQVGTEKNLTSVVTGEIKIDEMVRRQSEVRLCKSIIKDLARRSREEHAILAETDEENQEVVCVDFVTGKELPWHVVREARKQQLKYLRDLRVYEKVDERDAIEKC